MGKTGSGAAGAIQWEYFATKRPWNLEETQNAKQLSGSGGIGGGNGLANFRDQKCCKKTLANYRSIISGGYIIGEDSVRKDIPCIQKVFRPLHFFYILLRYSLICKLIKFIFLND